MAFQAVAPVVAIEVVALEKPVEVTLDLLRPNVPCGSFCDAEARVEQRTVHSLDEAVSARVSNGGGAVLNVVQGKEQLVGMVLGTPTGLTAVVR